MATFTVVAVVDGDTFEVNPRWSWNGQAGSRVRPTGYDAPELHSYGGESAKDRLTGLVLGREVQLGTAYRVDRGRLVCDVYFRDTRLADYFLEYR